MENQITIREAVTENDVAAFWEQLHAYHKRDIFPDSDDDELEYFLGSEYHDRIIEIYSRPKDRCFFLFFRRDGRDIGFAMPVIFTSEDGKCFIMEYCVYPEFRGNGTGRECAGVLLDWAKERGALYAELNCGSSERRRHFWKTVGFVENGADEWGDALMILPPAEDIPITAEVLADPDDWQLKKLENGFLKEIGEQPATEEKQEHLARAIRDGKITFFVAKRGCRAVGMCSVVKCFSTFACTDTGVFDDFYIEPVFRRKGIARMLTQAAQKWSRENALSGLAVTCAPCDEGMYRALGFDTDLGKTFTYLN
jgi:GNAT superfamily N-acetyltransferase